MAPLSELLHASRRRARAHGSLGRRTATVAGIGTLVAAALVGAAGVASAGGVTGDDSRATVVQGNINACPAGSPLLVDGGTSTTTQNGITVTVTQTTADTPNPFPANGVNTLPKGTDVLTVTLPAGKTLTGDIYVKGGDGYNDYPGTALTSLIPPVNNGGNIAGLSHFLICGTVASPPPAPPGTLVVDKVVTGAGAGSGGPFTIVVNCGAAGTKTYTNVTNGTSESASYPAGTSCTVTETDASGAATTTYTVGAGAPGNTAPTVTITSGNTTTVTVTNNFVPPAPPGTLVVDKVVTGAGAGSGGPFTIVVNCGAAGTKTYTNVTNGTSESASYPAGTSCTVTETDASGAATTTYTVGAGAPGNTAPTVTITSGNTTTVTVTNNFVTPPPPAPGNGTLVVKKAVTGTGPGNAGPFTITVDCGAAGTQTYTNVINGTSESANYPDGTHCTVTETNANGAKTTTYAVGSGAASSSAPTVTVNSGNTTTVTVTNNFPADPLRIVKAVDKTTAAYGDNLVYTLTVISGAGAPPQNVVVTDQVPAGTTFVSASCANPCTVGPPVGGLVTWNVGGMPASSSLPVTFTVHITPLAAGTPPTAETITNVGSVSSLTDPGGPSNTVMTDVPAVLGETFTQQPPTVTTTAPPTVTNTTAPTAVAATSTSALPFTGLPANRLIALAGLFLVSGAALVLVGRRRGALGED